MKLLISGGSGLLGHKLVQNGLKKGHEIYSIYNEHPIDNERYIQLNLTDPNKVFKLVSKLKPEVVIHTAAYTNVDSCEMDRETAWNVNAKATKHLALASADTKSHFIYVSTDYLLDGKKGLYEEDDISSPINYYGYTKFRGEEFVKANTFEWCITRPSVIYGWGFKHKLNFATWLIDNLSKMKEVKILADQFVSPTLNTNLSDILLEIAERNTTGILHTAGASRVSRLDFAQKLSETFNLNTNLIKPTKMTKILWKAKRPRDSSLNINKTKALLKVKPLTIDLALDKMREEMTIIDRHRTTR